MHGIVAAARANGLRCMDGPYAAYTDAAGFERSCRIARSMGFDGKQCIHPSQIAAVHAIFSPTADEIAHARRVVEACERGGGERTRRGAARRRDDRRSERAHGARGARPTAAATDEQTE